MKRLQSTGSVACVLGVLIAWGCGNEAPSTDNTQTNTTGASGNTTASATNGGSASAGTTATTGGGTNTVTTGSATTTTGPATTTSGTTSSSTSSGTTTSSGNSGSTTTGANTTNNSGSTTTGNSGSTTTGNSGSTTTGSSSTTTGTTTNGSTTTGGTTTGSDGGRGTTTGGRGTSTGTTGTTGTTTGTTTSGGGDGGASVNITMGTSSLDGYLFQYPCGTSHTGYDCANIGCSGNMVTKTTTFMVGGTAGTVYSMNFRVRGVVEGYQYKGGTRDQGTTSQNTSMDLFYQGGSAQASGADGYDYNTYEIDVAPAVGGAPNVYFLNSAPGNPHTDTTLQHLTFPIDYTKTIKITGGGTITFKVFDSNCTQVMNCGPTAGNMCSAPRTVSLAGGMPAAPASFTQPFQMPTGAYGQWIYFDIISVQ